MASEHVHNGFLRLCDISKMTIDSLNISWPVNIWTISFCATWLSESPGRGPVKGCCSWRPALSQLWMKLLLTCSQLWHTMLFYIKIYRPYTRLTIFKVNHITPYTLRAVFLCWSCSTCFVGNPLDQERVVIEDQSFIHWNKCISLRIGLEGWFAFCRCIMGVVPKPHHT